MMAGWQEQPVSRRRFFGMLGTLALGAAALAACGNTATATTGSVSGGAGGEVPNGTYGGSKFSSAVTAQKVDVAAVANALKWDKAQYTATAGDVTFVVKNPTTTSHQFGVEGNGSMYESGDFGPNTTTNLTIKGLKAGTYDIVCNFPGHKAAGMVAKLAVS
jgi:uncharacterized cupredoxin-like copper-binding protein